MKTVKKDRPIPPKHLSAAIRGGESLEDAFSPGSRERVIRDHIASKETPAAPRREEERPTKKSPPRRRDAEYA